MAEVARTYSDEMIARAEEAVDNMSRAMGQEPLALGDARDVAVGQMLEQLYRETVHHNQAILGLTKPFVLDGELVLAASISLAILMNMTPEQLEHLKADPQSQESTGATIAQQIGQALGWQSVSTLRKALDELTTSAELFRGACDNDQYRQDLSMAIAAAKGALGR